MDTSTVPRPGLDDDTFVGLVIDRRRHLAVPLRWPGIAEHNVVALFPTLRSAGLAARRLAARPTCVSAVVLLPVDPALLASVAVGVHTAHREVAEEATVSFRRSGAVRVSRFTREPSEIDLTTDTGARR